jgi:hypothetical protein
MKNMVSKKNIGMSDCRSQVGNWFYYAVRFFAYFFFYYFMQFTNEDKGITVA